jgi:hypothetical protein
MRRAAGEDTVKSLEHRKSEASDTSIQEPPKTGVRVILFKSPFHSQENVVD